MYGKYQLKLYTETQLFQVEIWRMYRRSIYQLVPQLKEAYQNQSLFQREMEIFWQQMINNLINVEYRNDISLIWISKEFGEIFDWKLYVNVVVRIDLQIGYVSNFH